MPVDDEVTFDPKTQESQGVWLHVYHCDPFTGCLNRILLKHVEMGIYHCGVEVNGEEWSFQYYEDTWNDPTVSGLQRCSPMFMPEYEFQESIYLGPTPCSEGEVDEIIHSLELAYPACSYHITRKNCLTFAEHLAGLLKVPKPFPDSLKGILQASNNSRPADAIVDCTWSCLKRWMIWKHSTDGQGSSGICSLL